MQAESPIYQKQVSGKTALVLHNDCINNNLLYGLQIKWVTLDHTSVNKHPEKCCLPQDRQSLYDLPRA